MNGWEELVRGAAIGAGAGFVAGCVHFLGLRPTAALFAAGRPRQALALQLARFALVALVFFALTRIGALALVAGLGGLLAGRALVLRHVRIEETTERPGGGREGRR